MLTAAGPTGGNGAGGGALPAPLCFEVVVMLDAGMALPVKLPVLGLGGSCATPIMVCFDITGTTPVVPQTPAAPSCATLPPKAACLLIAGTPGMA